MTKKAILTVGPSCVGKSSFVDEIITDSSIHFYVEPYQGLLYKELGFDKDTASWVNIERDHIRFSLFTEGVRDWTKYKFNKKNENEVSKEYQVVLERAIKMEANLLLTDTWLNAKYRNEMIKKLEDNGYGVTLKDDWGITLEELWKRNAQRYGGIDPHILYQQWKQYCDYKGIKQYVKDPSKKKAVVFDVDGTLMDMTGIRKPYEWDKVGLDKPIQVIVDMMIAYDMMGYQIIVVSGRDGCCVDATKESIIKAVGFDHFWLFQRNAGDMRKDTIVKEEIFWKHIADNWQVEAWVDDRPCVCRHMRMLGLKVIQVADPHIEF